MMSGMAIGIVSIALICTGSKAVGYTLLMLLVSYQHTPSLLSTLWMTWKVSMMTEWKEVGSTPKLQMRESSGSFRQKLQETLSDEHKCEEFIDWM